MYEDDTIAAVATAMANAGIGIIRISGKDAFSIAGKVFVPADKKKKIENLPGYTVHYGKIVSDGEILDEVLLLKMKAPHSYTAEDTVEIDCHGGRFVMQKILEAVVKNGARPADPGEFTKRAFINGRIDLSQAESVMTLISSQNELAMRASISQLQGSVKKKIEELRAEILYENAYLEAALDDPEHMSLDGFSEKLYGKILHLSGEIQKLLDTADDGRILTEGIRTVIVGRPNAGKSTLMNALLGKERAIVTEMEGTTRDVIEEHLHIGNISLILLDTAGIRDTEDPVEKIGVDKAEEELGGADLVLYVVDSSEPLDDRDMKIMELLKGRKFIVLLNKSDLENVTSEETLRGQLAEKKICAGTTECPVIEISAKDGEGIENIEEEISTLFFNEEVNFNDEVIITNVRQKKNLSDAMESLKLVGKAIEDGVPEDLYSVDLTDAYTSLGYIIGVETGEDLINEVFSRFCMGK